MNASPYILVLSSVESVISSGYYSRLFHKLSIQLKTMGIDVTVLSPKSIEGEGGKFNTQQLSWLRYCVDTAGGFDLYDHDNRPAQNSNHFVLKIQDIIKGSVQIFKQCRGQKPAILQVHQPLSYGLMALPASLVLGIPMVLFLGVEQEALISKSWLNKFILKKLMAWSEAIIVSSQQIKSDLKSQLCDIEIVVIPQEEPTSSTPSRDNSHTDYARNFFSTKKINSSYWQKTIALWCNFSMKFFDGISSPISAFGNEKDFINIKNGFGQTRLISSQKLCKERKRYISPVINIAYYRKREFYKLVNR